MLLKKPVKVAPDDRLTASRTDDRWRLAGLEAAQRRNLNAAGRGDGPERTSRRWSIRHARRAEHHT
jgi:hypothetical protein